MATNTPGFCQSCGSPLEQIYSCGQPLFGCRNPDCALFDSYFLQQRIRELEKAVLECITGIKRIDDVLSNAGITKDFNAAVADIEADLGIREAP